MACALKDPSVGIPHRQGGDATTREFDGKIVQSRRCPDCGYVYFPAPTDAELNKFYQEIYPEGAKSWYNVASDYAESKRIPRAQRVIDIAASYGFGSDTYYHEIGCAFGGTVYELQRRGLKVTGTELNEDAVVQGRARGARDIHSSSDVDFLGKQDRRPDVVFGYHVLEHIPDAVGYIRSLSALVSSNGIIVMFVPNAMAFFPTMFGFVRYVWYGYPEHIHLLSPHSALCLAEASGQTLLGIGTRDFGIEREAMDRAVSLPHGSAVSSRVRAQLLESAMMNEELAIVLSQNADLRRVDTMGATTRAKRNAHFEADVASLGENAHLPNPWSA